MAFCRYADDCNIYVKSKRSGERVMRGTRAYLEKALRLRINEAKSAVARPGTRKFLGYRVALRRRQAHIWIAPQGIKRLMDRGREVVREGRGWSLTRAIQALNPLLRGWANYFRLSVHWRRLQDLDGWVRRRLRCLLWRQWKRPRTRRRKLIELGLSPERAWKSRCQWPWALVECRGLALAAGVTQCLLQEVFSIRDIVDRLQRVHRTAVCGPACMVVWEG